MPVYRFKKCKLKELTNYFFLKKIKTYGRH